MATNVEQAPDAPEAPSAPSGYPATEKMFGPQSAPSGLGDALGTKSMESSVAFAKPFVTELNKPITESLQKTADLRQQLATQQGEELRISTAAKLKEADASDAAYKAFKTAGTDSAAEYHKRLSDTPLPEWAPTKDSVQDLAGVFSLIGILGTAMGKGAGHGAAMSSLAAMTGMMKGWQEGRQDLYQKEKDTFDKETARLTKMHEEFYKELQDAQRLAHTDLEAGTAMAHNAAIRFGATAVDAQIKQKGLQAGIDAQAEIMKAADAFNKQVLDLAGKAYARVSQNPKYIQAKTPHGGMGYFNPSTNTFVRDAGGNIIEAAPKTSGSAAVQGMNSSVIGSLQEVASNLENEVRVAGGTTTGALPYLNNSGGFINYLKDKGIRGITGDEQKVLQNIAAGQGVALATIMRGGRSQGIAGLSDKVQSKMNIDSGDSLYVAAFKIADIKRVSKEYVESLITQGQLTGDQAKSAQAQLDRMDRAIPWNTTDVLKALQDSNAKPNYKREIMGKIMLSTQPGIGEEEASSPSASPKASLNGRSIEVRDNKWVYSDTGEEAK